MTAFFPAGTMPAVQYTLLLCNFWQLSIFFFCLCGIFLAPSGLAWIVERGEAQLRLSACTCVFPAQTTWGRFCGFIGHTDISKITTFKSVCVDLILDTLHLVSLLPMVTKIAKISWSHTLEGPGDCTQSFCLLTESENEIFSLSWNTAWPFAGLVYSWSGLSKS